MPTLNVNFRQIDPAKIEALQQYEDLAGISVDQAIDAALDDYLEVVVATRLGVMARKTASA